MFARNEKIAKTFVLRPITVNRRSAVFRQECDSGGCSKKYTCWGVQPAVLKSTLRDISKRFED